MPKFIVSLFLLFSLVACAQQQKGKAITTVGVEKFEKLLSQEKNAILLDVRTPEEFAEGHLPKAKNINIFDATFDQQVSKFPKTQAVFVYCRSGHRSMNAARRLKKLGFKKVYNLDGGIMAWEAQKKSIEK